MQKLVKFPPPPTTPSDSSDAAHRLEPQNTLLTHILAIEDAFDATDPLRLHLAAWQVGSSSESLDENLWNIIIEKAQASATPQGIALAQAMSPCKTVGDLLIDYSDWEQYIDDQVMRLDIHSVVGEMCARLILQTDRLIDTISRTHGDIGEHLVSALRDVAAQTMKVWYFG